MKKFRTFSPLLATLILAGVAILAGWNLGGATPPQKAPVDVTSAENTTVTLTTELGVTKTVSVNTINDSDPVLKDLLGYWNIDTANFMVQTENGVYIVIPQEIFRSAETIGGKTIVRLSNGETLQGNLVGTLAEGPTATIMQQHLNVYPLGDCVKLELLTLDGAYVKYHAENSTQAGGDRPLSPWGVYLPERSEASFRVTNPRLIYSYFSTAGYIVGGQTQVKETGSFEVRVADKTHTVNLDDFREIDFSLHGSSHEAVTLEANAGIKTTGAIAITDLKRGDLYLLGEWVSNPHLRVAIRMTQCRIRHED